MSTYVWRAGTAMLASIDAQLAGERLEQVRVASNGHLTPAAVVDDARSLESPLHKAFQWDDEKAAIAHRLDQARYLISRIAVKVTPESGGDERTVRAFVNVSDNSGRGYTSIAHAMGDDEMRKQVLQKAWQELQGWQQRYREYEELQAVFAVINETKVA